MSLLTVNNLGKAYRSYRSEWHRFANWFGFSIKPAEEQWVLRNVSFEIQAGESIGIIGQNGAGKSSLLKMIAGTLKPSEGQITVNGRISAILELGMSFDPELTGRQNVFHAAGLMGFSAEEIQQAMPDIEAFAEIGEYFDEPVRTYSSGMEVRVAFSVATAYRSEILIVDEALSVGDAYFQHKSFSRIREFQEMGTTLLIVSHDRSAIQSLCNRAILLENNTVIKDAGSEEVFDFYNATIAEKENSKVEVRQLENGKTQTISGTGEALVEEIYMCNSKGEVVEVVGVGELVELRIKVKVNQLVDTLVLGYCIKDRFGQVMFGTNTWHTDQVIKSPQPGDEFHFVIVFPANFGEGSYSVATTLQDRDSHMSASYDWRDLALVFNVINKGKNQFSGCNWMKPEISVKAV